MSDQPDVSTLALLLGDKIVRRAQTHPLSTMLGASVAGYVLARGLPKPLLSAGMSIAARMVAGRLIAEFAVGTAHEPEQSVEPTVPEVIPKT